MTNQSTSPYKGIIFDLDGTLLNTAEGILSSLRYTIDVMGYEPLPEEVMRTFIGPPVKHSLKAAYQLSEEEASCATEVFRARYKDHDLLKAVPYEGITTLLSLLKQKGFLVGVATLKRDDYAHSILEHFHINELCDSICGSDFESRMNKTDVLNKCIEEMKLTKEQVVLIGDTASDGKGATEAGVDFIAVTYGFGPRTKEEWLTFKPVFTAGDVSELSTFLKSEE